MKTEKILEDAEIAAVFFRALVEKGVPIGAAVSLTGSYITAKQITDQSEKKPKEPWEPPTP